MIDQLHLVAALDRDLPDSRRPGRFGVVQVLAVGRLICLIPPLLGDLDGITTGRRNFPDLPLTRTFGPEIDPSCVGRPARADVASVASGDSVHASIPNTDDVDVETS